MSIPTLLLALLAAVGTVALNDYAGGGPVKTPPGSVAPSQPGEAIGRALEAAPRSRSGLTVDDYAGGGPV